MTPPIAIVLVYIKVTRCSVSSARGQTVCVWATPSAGQLAAFRAEAALAEASKVRQLTLQLMRQFTLSVRTGALTGVPPAPQHFDAPAPWRPAARCTLRHTAQVPRA